MPPSFHLGFCNSLLINLCSYSCPPTNHIHICSSNDLSINQIISLSHLTWLTWHSGKNPNSVLLSHPLFLPQPHRLSLRSSDTQGLFPIQGCSLREAFPQDSCWLTAFRQAHLRVKVTSSQRSSLTDPSAWYRTPSPLTYSLSHCSMFFSALKFFCYLFMRLF